MAAAEVMGKKSLAAVALGRGASVVGKTSVVAAAAAMAAATAGVTSARVARVTPLEGCLACLVTRGWRGEGGDLTTAAYASILRLLGASTMSPMLFMLSNASFIASFMPAASIQDSGARGRGLEDACL